MRAIEVEALWRPEVQQAVFKKVLLAMSYVGTSQELPGEIAAEQTAVAVLAALVDEACSYSNPHQVLTASEVSFLSSNQEDADRADYVIADLAADPSFEPKVGSIYRPDESATVILRDWSDESEEYRWILQGPGIPDFESLVGGKSLAAWIEWRERLIAYPLGVDMILCRPPSIIGIPRTTVIRKAEENL